MWIGAKRGASDYLSVEADNRSVDSIVNDSNLYGCNIALYLRSSLQETREILDAFDPLRISDVIRSVSASKPRSLGRRQPETYLPSVAL
jgi:hypothetical protein